MSAAAELGDIGITANVVHPPVTDFGLGHRRGAPVRGQQLDLIHVAEPADVAEVIVWPCSDAARMVTGNVIRMR